MAESLDLYIAEIDELAGKVQANLVRAVDNYCTLYQAMQEIKEGKGIPMEDIVTEMEAKYHLSKDL